MNLVAEIESVTVTESERDLVSALVIESLTVTESERDLVSE